MRSIMTRKGYWTCFFFALAVATLSVSGHGNDHGVVSASIGGGKVSVEYHRPSAQGRDLLSMVSPGVYWRIGADTPTTLTTDVDLMFGQTRVAKGTYVLSAHFVSASEWRLVVSKDLGRRGAAPAEILAEVPGTLGQAASPTEILTITLTGDGSKGQFIVDWGTRRLSADFQAA